MHIVHVDYKHGAGPIASLDKELGKFALSFNGKPRAAFFSQETGCQHIEYEFRKHYNAKSFSTVAYRLITQNTEVQSFTLNTLSDEKPNEQ